MNHANLDDADLVALTLSGDQSAYEQLVIRHQSAAIAAATRVIGSPCLAEDAVQDAFVTAWMKLDTLDQPEKFGVWICRIARNCALNMRTRFRECLPEETLEQIPGDQEASPEELLIRSEDNRTLRESIAKLPEKIAETIRLHYFCGLSVAEIAARLGLSEGGVKWRLYKGRERLREDLAAMNEDENDTLVQRIMKKVEELKEWTLKADKSGFETVYEDVLSEVEKMPESAGKYNMLADVLLRGNRWIPGKGNEALFEAIRDAAEKGRNEEVMRFTLDLEYRKNASGKDWIQYIREKQIPRLEAAGLSKALGYLWYQLGRIYHWGRDYGASIAAYQKAREILTPADLYYAVALSMERLARDISEIGKDADDRSYQLTPFGTGYRFIDGELRLWDHPSEHSEGWIRGESAMPAIWRNASLCGKRFFFDAKEVGEYITDERGKKMIYGGIGHTVVTPAGTFENCVLWTSEKQNNWIETYYKSGVGIVRQDYVQTFRTVYLLSECELAGGSGLLPACTGNRWSYVCDRDPRYFTGLASVEITHADSESVITADYFHLQRHGYDPDIWRDMALAVRCEFAKENPDRTERLADVRPYIARMKELAKTPYEIAHTGATCNVMERLLSSWDLNPDRTEDAVWNSFRSERVKNRDGKIYLEDDRIFDIWWSWGNLTTDAICCGDCYEFLQDGFDAVWYDDFAEEQESVPWVWKFGSANKNDLKVKKAGTVITTAGSFTDCIQLSMNVMEPNRGWYLYSRGRKEYYFAPGVGIVKAVHHFENQPDAVYELCEYTGIGEGYFPAGDGFRRYYRAKNLPDVDRASVEYTFVKGDDGELYMLTDQTGMRRRGKELNRFNLYGF